LFSVNTAKYDLIWGDYDRQTESDVPNPQVSAMSVVRQYLDESTVGRHENPLSWWRDRQLLYKHLIHLPKRYLCIVATSVPSERIFSKSGQLISARRSRLSPKTVRVVMFLNQNIKFIL
jgi:hypothetical protein